MPKVIQYEHHGERVWVREALRGAHKNFCLCYSCSRFSPGARDNCKLAALNYALCVAEDLVLPVWECPKYVALPQLCGVEAEAEEAPAYMSEVYSLGPSERQEVVGVVLVNTRATGWKPCYKLRAPSGSISYVAVSDRRGVLDHGLIRAEETEAIDPEVHAKVVFELNRLTRFAKWALDAIGNFSRWQREEKAGGRPWPPLDERAWCVALAERVAEAEEVLRDK